MKRNLVEELKILKDRSGFGYSDYYISLLRRTREEYSNTQSVESLKYLPIACIACFESFFRSTYKTIIDLGKPYSDGIEKFRKDGFGFDIVKAFHDRAFTLGEFVSFSIPCNKLSDINLTLTNLLGFDFLEALRKYEKRSIFDHVNEITDNYQRNFAAIISGVNRTFQLRHIFCHEFGAHVTVSREEILSCYESCMIFLKHTDNVIWNTIYPDSPETQSEMNAVASQQFQESQDRLDKLVIEIKKRMTTDYELGLFDEAMNHWMQMREISGNLYSNPAEQGTIFPTLRFVRLSILTDDKFNSLSKEFPEIEIN